MNPGSSGAQLMIRKRNFSRVRFQLGATLALAGAALLAGCGKPEEIEHYRVDKPEVVQHLFPDAAVPKADVPKPERPRGSDRMLAAIVPHGELLWFFKLAGPGEAVGGQEPAFDEFIASLTFGDKPSAPPEWKLPAGWHEQPGTAMRYATVAIDLAGTPLELSVTKLSRPPDKDDDAVLSNINRWRGQMGLSPLAPEELADATTRVKLAGGQAIEVKLVGRLKAGGMGAPFANGGLPADHPPLPADHPPVGPDGSALPADHPPVEPAGNGPEIRHSRRLEAGPAQCHAESRVCRRRRPAEGRNHGDGFAPIRGRRAGERQPLARAA